MRYNQPVLSKGYLHMKQIGSQRTESMGRVIWEAVKGVIPEGFVVDHINSNRLDNRIENLQLLTPTQNTQRSATGTITKRKYNYLARRMYNGVRYAKSFKTRCGAMMFNNTIILKSKYQRRK